MSASQYEPETFMIADMGNAPEIFASGVEVQTEADHAVLRWFRDRHDGDRYVIRMLVAEIIVSHATAALLGRQFSGEVESRQGKASALRLAS